MKTCPYFHDHTDNDPSYDDCVIAYEDAKARLAPQPQLIKRPMLVQGRRYHVVYREAGKRNPRDMIVDFISQTEQFVFWSGRPEFGTIEMAFADVLEFQEVMPAVNPLRRPRPVRSA